MNKIEFSYDVTWGNFLHTLLDGTNYQQYNWYFSEQDIFFSIIKKSRFLKVTSGKLFAKILNSGKKYLVVMANIQVFDTKSNIKRIRDYEDFINSDCKLVILVSNTTDYEIYFKDNELKSIILNNLKKLNIPYKEVTKDTRKYFHLGN